MCVRVVCSALLTLSIMNFSRFINTFSSLRKASPLRKLTEIQQEGGEKLISFGTGAPNASLFPFETISVQTRDGEQFDLKGDTLTRALQYGPTSGFPELVGWLKSLQKEIHKPPRGEAGPDDLSQMDLLITPGSQDGLSKLKPYDLKYLTVECDDEGMRPESLRERLSKWRPEDARDPHCLLPKLLYLQPNYSNPTGATIPFERRKEIMDIAKEYDLLIVEDDPYYFLGFDSNPVPSFLSMDTEGRVLRLDSFSKVLSSGMRLGFVTGSRAFIQRLTLALQVSSMHSSSLSQMLVYLFLTTKGRPGFLSHTRKVAEFYAEQASRIAEAADQHLQGLADWCVPKGGMFLWLKVKGVTDTNRMILEEGLKKQVVFAPGKMFMVDSSGKSEWVRASFSNVTPEKMHQGFIRLAELIKEEQAR